MMKVIVGDITEVKHGYICHQVNCKRVAGAGLALQIRRKWPDWYTHYLATKPVLGKADVYKVGNGLYVVSLYAQNGYGRAGRYTDYDALRKSLEAIKHLDDLYIPYGMGAGLAGGDWSMILSILEEIVPHATLVRL